MRQIFLLYMPECLCLCCGCSHYYCAYAYAYVVVKTRLKGVVFYEKNKNKKKQNLRCSRSNEAFPEKFNLFATELEEIGGVLDLFCLSVQLMPSF